MTRAERVYLVVVAALAADTFSSRTRTFGWWPEGVLLLVLLPALVPALPLVHVFGATAWNVTGADAGGPMWPVALAHALLLTAVGAANVLAVRAVRTWWHSRADRPWRSDATQLWWRSRAADAAPAPGVAHTEGRPARPAGGGRS